MSTLLRKELRLASDVVAGAVALLLLSFPLALIGVAMQGIRPLPWVSIAAGGCILNQYTLVLTGGLVGAVAFAREREDGNLHFLAFLPITRARQFVAKLIVAFGLWCGLWLVNATLFSGLVLSLGEGFAPWFPILGRMFGVLALSFAALGMASLAGCYLSSVTGATFAGLASLLALAVARFVIMGLWGDEDFSGPMTLLTLGLFGAAAIAMAGHAFCVGPSATPKTLKGGGKKYARSRTSDRIHSWGPTASLLWKDANLLKTPAAVGLVLVGLPFAAAAANAFGSGEGAEGLRTASVVAMTLGWLVLPLWSATALAGEWPANTHHFLAYLPVSTWRVLAAKFLVATAPAALVVIATLAAFLIAQSHIPGDPPIRLAMTWDEFNASGFLAGAVAYASALPITFGVAWFFAARMRRVVLPTILGIVSGPVAMAAWAVTSAYAVDLAPMATAILHATILTGASLLLVMIGARRLIRVGF